MIDEPARALSSVEVDRGMPEAQRAALGAILAEYGFANVRVNASLMMFSDPPPWSIELTANATAFFQAIADAAIAPGTGEAGNAADARELGAKIGHFLGQLGAVPGRPNGSISLYDAESSGKAMIYHPGIPLPPEAYAALAGLPWPSFAAPPPLLFPDREQRCWVAQRRGTGDQFFPWPPPAHAGDRDARRALIVTALGVETAAVRVRLTNPERENGPHGDVYTKGRFDAPNGPWTVLVAQVGRHNEPAAAATVRAVTHWEPEIVLFVGVAGGLKDVRAGDVIAATKVYAYATGKQEGAFLPRPELQHGTHRLVQLANYLAQVDEWSPDGAAPRPQLLVEPIASGPVVLASSATPLRAFLRESYGDAVAIEQEGYGFHSALAAHPTIAALVVRGVSDTLDNKATGAAELDEDERRRRQEEDDARQRLAVRNAAAFAFALIAALSPAAQQRAGADNPARLSTLASGSAAASGDAKQRPQAPAAATPSWPIAADVLLPNSRRWQDAEARADAWSDQHRDQRSFPAPLPPKPWLLLHLVPYLPLALGVPVARLRELALPYLPPPGQVGDFGAEVRDGGLLSLPTRARDSASAGFAMLWPTGHLAAALALPRVGPDRRSVGLRRLETLALAALQEYVLAIQALQVPLPIRILIILAEIRGVALVDEVAASAPRQSLQSDTYIMPETLDDWSTTMPELFRARWNQLWRGVGYPEGSPGYDMEGVWRPLQSGEGQ